jgi:hypothetical protein
MALAYANGDPEIGEWVARLQEWIEGKKPAWEGEKGLYRTFDRLGLSLNYKTFNARIKHGKKKKQ